MHLQETKLEEAKIVGSQPTKPVNVQDNKLLLVDDDPAVLRAYRKALSLRGWNVETACDGAQAIERLRRETFDVIVSDVSMPEVGGLEFLRNVREQDLDVPVVLMTGAPKLESAMRAVESGAFRYLVKPVEVDVLDDTIRRASQLHRLAQLKRQALEIAGTDHRWFGDQASLEAGFARALGSIWMAYQPIVSVGHHNVFGYEALLRSDDSALPHPGAILEAAEQVRRVHDLGRVVRTRVADDARETASDLRFFVNLHALDMNDEHLYSAGSELAAMASRTVLEITERASLEGVSDVQRKVKRLRELGFQIAVDDLGAGYAGLTSFSQLEPDIAKIDMSLVRGIDSEPRKQSIVRSMTRLCDELGTLVVVEGVETEAERDTLIDLGCDLLQGYLFAKPERGFRLPAW
jgi:EAL domain-containing protein (putative c-di-GMP-specific phosphodiesterase class I)